jgi:hypothetical protein
MTREVTVHLSEEALNDVLIGLGSAESERHMAECAECRLKARQFKSDVALFNQASIAWSEAQPPGRNKTVARMAPAFPMPVGFLGVFALVILAVAVVIPVWQHEHSQHGNQENTAAIVNQDSQVQIAQDNRLMEAVNAALSPQDESPVVEYGLLERHKTHRKARPK